MPSEWFQNPLTIKQVLHFAQLEYLGKFAQYDYGEEKNLELYGQSTPPEHDLRKIKVPVAMWVGDKDMLSSPRDNEYVKGQL